MSSTKSARAPASTEVLPVHFTAAGGFYRRRPKLSAGPCRTTPPSSGRRGIEQVPEGTKALPVHLTALGGFHRRRPKLSAGPCRATAYRAGAVCIGWTAAH